MNGRELNLGGLSARVTFSEPFPKFGDVAVSALTGASNRAGYLDDISEVCGPDGEDITESSGLMEGTVSLTRLDLATICHLEADD